MRGAGRVAFWALLAAVVVVVGTLMASPASAATFVYVGNAESNEIYVLELDRQSGALTVVEKVLIPGIEKPGISTPMSVSPDRRFLYVGTRGEPRAPPVSRSTPPTARPKTTPTVPSPTAWPT